MIGITQFPSTFHPNIDSMLASIHLGDDRRPLQFMTPNGGIYAFSAGHYQQLSYAAKEVSPDGKNGVAVTFTIHPKATWGDGVPVTTKDVIFTWKVGRHKRSGVGNAEFYRSLYKIDPIDEKTFIMHFDKLTFEYNSIGGFGLLPAHIEQKNFSDPEIYKNQTAFDGDTTNSGLYFGPYRIAEVVLGSHVVLVPILRGMEQSLVSRVLSVMRIRLLLKQICFRVLSIW